VNDESYRERFIGGHPTPQLKGVELWPLQIFAFLWSTCFNRWGYIYCIWPSELTSQWILGGRSHPHPRGRPWGITEPKFLKHRILHKKCSAAQNSRTTKFDMTAYHFTDHKYAWFTPPPNLKGVGPTAQHFHTCSINISSVWPSSTIFIRSIDHSQALPFHSNQGLLIGGLCRGYTIYWEPF